MKNSKCLVIFPSSVNSPFSESGICRLGVTALLTSWQGQSSPQICNGAWGLKVYLYIHVQTVVKSNVIKIDLLTLSLAHGLVSVKAARQYQHPVLSHAEV